MKKLDTFAMYRNIEMATDNKTDLEYFYHKACKYLESPDLHPRRCKEVNRNHIRKHYGSHSP